MLQAEQLPASIADLNAALAPKLPKTMLLHAVRKREHEKPKGTKQMREQTGSAPSSRQVEMTLEEAAKALLWAIARLFSIQRHRAWPMWMQIASRMAAKSESVGSHFVM